MLESIETLDREELKRILPLTHDQFFGETFKQKKIAKAFLKHKLPSEIVQQLDLDNLSVEPRFMPDDVVFKELIADVVYRVPVKNTVKHVDFYVVLEHKSYNDHWTIFQLWVYIFQLCWQEFRKAKEEKRLDLSFQLPPVVAIILHHGETAFTGCTELSYLFAPIANIDKYLPKLQAILVDLSAIDDNEVPNDSETLELRVVLSVLRLAFRKDVELKIGDVLEELKPYSEIPEIRRLIRTVWLYIASSAKYAKRNYKQLLNSVKTVIGEDVMPTLLEIWMEEGIALGEAKGEAKGEVKGKVEAVLAILRARFKRVPASVEQSLCGMSDPVSLDSWIVGAATCDSIDDFEKDIR